MKILLCIKYDGKAFCGYQVQNNKRTVQGELNLASLAVHGVKCNITGCSRTDSMVHAQCFYLTVEAKDGSELNIPTDKLTFAYNAHLPEDISVINAYRVDDDFHPRYDVINKEYTYLIHNSKIKDPFMSMRALHFPYDIDNLAIEKMRTAASYLIGEHDFCSFMASGSSVKDTVRRIDSVSVEKNGDIIVFKISGNGFLYNMVRIIVGTLLDVALGKIDAQDVKIIIESKDRKKAGKTVAAHGLYLSNVTYPVKFEIN